MILTSNLKKLETKVNGKDAYVLVEDNNGIITAHLHIWGPAFESYFLIGDFKYCDRDLFEKYIEEDVKAELPR